MFQLIDEGGMVELECHNFAIPNEIIDLIGGHQWLLETTRGKFYGEFSNEWLKLAMPEFTHQS